MANKTLIYAVVAFALLGILYFFFLRNDTPATPETESPAIEEEMVTENEEMTQDTMTVILSAQSESDESGTATLTEVDGQTRVVLSVDNAPEDTEQPAHIHEGSCPEPGDVVYPLTNVVGGTSQTILDVDLETLREQLPLAINVHQSAEEISTYVSCGDLE